MKQIRRMLSEVRHPPATTRAISMLLLVLTPISPKEHLQGHMAKLITKLTTAMLDAHHQRIFCLATLWPNFRKNAKNEALTAQRQHQKAKLLAM